MTIMRESRPEWNIRREITPTSMTYTGTEGKNSHRSTVQNIRFALTWLIVLWICSESCSFPKAAGLRVWSPQTTKAAASIGSREDLVHLVHIESGRQVAPSVTYQRCLLVWDPSSHFQRFSLKMSERYFVELCNTPPARFQTHRDASWSNPKSCLWTHLKKREQRGRVPGQQADSSESMWNMMSKINCQHFNLVCSARRRAANVGFSKLLLFIGFPCTEDAEIGVRMWAFWELANTAEASAEARLWFEACTQTDIIMRLQLTHSQDGEC